MKEAEAREIIDADERDMAKSPNVKATIIKTPIIKIESKTELLQKCTRRGFLLVDVITLLERCDDTIREHLEDMGQCDHEVGICMCEDFELRKQIKHHIKIIKEEVNGKSGQRA